MEEQQNKSGKKRKVLAILIIIAVILTYKIIFNNTSVNIIGENTKEISYNEFIEKVEKKEVAEIDYDRSSPKITGKLADGGMFITDNPQTDDFKKYLLEKGVKVNPVDKRDNGIIISLLTSVINLAIFAFVIIYVSKKLLMAQIKSTNTKLMFAKPNITFDDVAGNEEAKEDMLELVEFLKNPVKYKRYGAKIPRGTILYGPPGTGKTLMAKALAGTAGVPFISISGSDFVEKFVGVGASRVRQLFSEARAVAPCIIFIDEIDAVGKTRGGLSNGALDEREQTLNQLLVEMDGFTENDSIIVIAATNRIDTLDPALLRAGRFDRQIQLPLPDLEARYEILKIHARNKPLSEDVDLKEVAKMTLFMSGADLANIMNEASIYAARANHKGITMQDIDRAINKVIAGEARKNRKNISRKEKEITAYHEAGHALVAKMMAKRSTPKVTIIPTTKGAGGYTMITPEEKMFVTKREMLESIAISLAGRAAEELIFGEENITNGASQDIKQATQTAMQMVKDYGMNEKIGLVNVDELYGSSSTLVSNMDDAVAEEVRRIIDETYREVKDFLNDNKAILHTLAECLLDKETIYEKDLEAVINGEAPENSIFQKSVEGSGGHKIPVPVNQCN